MGVDHYQCAACNAAIYEEAVARCASCHQRVCVTCAICLPKNLRFKSGDIFDPDKCGSLFDHNNRLLSKHCPLCSGQSVSDTQVMEHLLTDARTTRAKVAQQMVEQRDRERVTKRSQKPAAPKAPKKPSAGAEKATGRTRKERKR